MTRVAVYARYSTDKQREASIEDQARNCRRIAEREGWTVAETYADQGISGSRTNHPDYYQQTLATRRPASLRFC